jgi:prepilin signal peptidase PulO-like enzyme (type II secretory pathway)
MMAWVAANQALLIGLVWMVVLGPAVGNYACSVVYRLPRGRTPFERHPFCGHCNADLQPRDLFPILSWFSTKGRCRYCRGPIPSIYTVIELACGAIFIGYFLKFGISEVFLLSAVYGVFVIILAAIQWQQGWVSSSVFAYALTAIALLRTLQEGTIYGWAGSAFVMMVLALTWQKFITSAMKKPFLPFETPWIWWMVLLAAWLQPSQWPLLLVPALLLVLFRGASAPVRPWVIVPFTAVALALPAMV